MVLCWPLGAQGGLVCWMSDARVALAVAKSRQKVAAAESWGLRSITICGIGRYPDDEGRTGAFGQQGDSDGS